MIISPIVVVGLVALTLFLACSYYSRSIPFDSHESDAAKQLRATAGAGQWRWPSDMHTHTTEGKARMKDVGVLSMVLVQRLY